MKRNVELLEQTMQYIEDHPEQHDQNMWVNYCGTAACFAGWALMLDGLTVPEVVALTEQWDGVRNAAAARLGLTRDEGFQLFTGTNSRPELQLMVKDLVNGDELRDPAEYHREAHL